MPAHAQRSTRPSPWVAVIAMAVAAAFLLMAIFVATPPAVVGHTVTIKAAACSGVNLRTKPSTSGAIKKTIGAGTVVTVGATVSGGSYRASCAGETVSGSRWYRITTINGKSVNSLYGVSYVYGATGLFKSGNIAKEAACKANLRTKPSSSSTLKKAISAGTKVAVVAKVDGTSHRVTCAGKTVSGSHWYKIKAINGKSVSSLYGVSYLYGAAVLFKPVSPTAAAPTPTPTPTPPPTATVTEGIDVSHWQGAIDWTKVRAAGKRFAFIKASDGRDFVDDQYATNRSGAKAAGLYVGAYHFARPDSSSGDAVAEADHFVATGAFAKGDLLPVLDLERTGGLSDVALEAWVKGFLGRVYERTGVRGVIYVSPSFWKNYVGDTSWFASNGYKVLWIAHWTTSSAPSVPAADWGSNGWTFWQYTSDGTVPGITGRVDLDRYRGTDFTKVRIP